MNGIFSFLVILTLLILFIAISEEQNGQANKKNQANTNSMGVSKTNNAANKPGVKPATNKSGAKPATNKSGAKPAANKPGAKPAASKPGAKPVAKQGKSANAPAKKHGKLKKGKKMRSENDDYATEGYGDYDDYGGGNSGSHYGRNGHTNQITINVHVHNHKR